MTFKSYFMEKYDHDQWPIPNESELWKELQKIVDTIDEYVDYRLKGDPS